MVEWWDENGVVLPRTMDIEALLMALMVIWPNKVVKISSVHKNKGKDSDVRPR